MTNTASVELLEAKSREELLEIASAAGVPIPPRTRKPGIISAILGAGDISSGSSGQSTDRSQGSQDSATSVAATRATEAGRPEAGRTRTVTLQTNDQRQASGSRQTDGSGSANSNGNGASASSGGGANGGAGEEAQNGNEIAEDANRRSRRRGRERDEQFQGEAASCDGLLDLREEGYGFLRISGLLPSPDDVYVAVRHVRRYGLRRGDRVTGASRPATRSEKNPALLRLDTINGEVPNVEESRPLFEDFAAINPTTALPLANGQLDNSAKQLFSELDRIAPLGYGQRGLLIGDSQANLTSLVEMVGTAIADNHPDVHLMVLLIDERPELITDLTRRLETSGEVIASSFDRPPDEHVAVAELTLERAKRKAEQGQDVVVVFDGLTRLARAHRRIVNHRQSQVTSEHAAVAAAKSVFGAARNLEQAGSITMLATTRADTGNEFDVASLDEFCNAANLTWTLKSSGKLELDESGCASSFTRQT